MATFSRIDNDLYKSQTRERLNECAVMIYEKNHELTDYDLLIEWVTNYMTKNRVFKDFYSHYKWSSPLEKCVRENNEYHIFQNEYPIYIQFDNLPQGTDAVTLSKEESPDKIIIIFDKQFLIINNWSEESIRGSFKHEFIHVFHGYSLDIDMLSANKNVGNFYSITDIPEDIRHYFTSSNALDVFKPLMYFNSETEFEGRMNGIAGHIRSLDIMQVNLIYKRHQRAANKFRLSTYDKINCLFNDSIYFSKYNEYKQYVDRIGMMYTSHNVIPNFQSIVALGYILHLYEIFDTKPKIDEKFIKEHYIHYNKMLWMKQHPNEKYELSDDEILIIGQIVQYFENRLLLFHNNAFSMIYTIAEELGFI